MRKHFCESENGHAQDTWGYKIQGVFCGQDSFRNPSKKEEIRQKSHTKVLAALLGISMAVLLFLVVLPSTIFGETLIVFDTRFKSNRSSNTPVENITKFVHNAIGLNLQDGTMIESKVAVWNHGASEEVKELINESPLCLDSIDVNLAIPFMQGYLSQFGPDIDFSYTEHFRKLVSYPSWKRVGKRFSIPIPEVKCRERMPIMLLCRRQNQYPCVAENPNRTVVVFDDMLCSAQVKKSNIVSGTKDVRIFWYPKLFPSSFTIIARKGATNSDRTFLTHLVSLDGRKSAWSVIIEEKLGESKFAHLKGLPPQKIWRPPLNYTHSSRGFRDILINSDFTPCPAYNNISRIDTIFEAVESGSIPIVNVNEVDSNIDCEHSLERLMALDTPFLFIKSWSDLPNALSVYVDNPLLISKKRQELSTWHITAMKSIRTQLKDLAFSIRSATQDTKAHLEEKKASQQTSSSQPKLLYRNEKNGNSLPVTNVGQIPLITGCGRSGTLSVMMLLKSIGIKAVHEGIAPQSVSVSWLYAAKLDTGEFIPFEDGESIEIRSNLERSLPHNKLIFGPVVHLTRHPLSVISSTWRCFCGRGDVDRVCGQLSDCKSWSFVERHLPDRMPNQVSNRDLLRSARYWLEWNKMIERNFPHQRAHVRLEDSDAGAIVRGLGFNNVSHKVLKMATVPRSKAHVSPEQKKTKLYNATWTQLYETHPGIAREIFDLAQSYGYDQSKTLESAIAEEH